MKHGVMDRLPRRQSGTTWICIQHATTTRHVSKFQGRECSCFHIAVPALVVALPIESLGSARVQACLHADPKTAENKDWSSTAAALSISSTGLFLCCFWFSQTLYKRALPGECWDGDLNA